MKVNDRGIWLENGGHKHDADLSQAIADTLLRHQIKSVIDIGCGDCSYSDYLTERGLECIGYDGNPNSDRIADFSELQNLGFYDCVLSLEVGEHIPAEYESNFIANLTNHARKLIIMSWAIPGQGGVGHVNECENNYVILLMLERGWRYERHLSDNLRASVSNCYWLRDTIMAFRRVS